MLFSPMEQFSVFDLVSINVSLNNVVFYLLVGALISPLLLYIGSQKGAIYPTGWGIISETLFGTILNMVTRSGITTVYFPLI